MLLRNQRKHLHSKNKIAIKTSENFSINREKDTKCVNVKFYLIPIYFQHKTKTDLKKNKNKYLHKNAKQQEFYEQNNKNEVKYEEQNKLKI